MTAPSSTTFTITSGSLSTLDRYSAYGVSEPSVHVANPSVGNYDFDWDFVSTALRVTSVILEYSLSGTYGYDPKAYGSNDGTTWTAISVTGIGSTETSGPTADAVFRTVFPLSTDKFYRYLRFQQQVSLVSGLSGLKFQTANFVWDASRAWSADGSGGVGPGGGGGPGDGEGGGANDPGGENDPHTHEGFAMSDLAIYAGDMVLNWLKGTAFASPPDDVWVALFDGDPEDTDTPGVELTGTLGLTRQKPTFGTIVARYMLNMNKLDFGAPSSDVTVACFGLYDAETGGNLLTRKVLAVPGSFLADAEIIIQPGKLPVYY